MKALRTHRALILGLLAFSAMLAAQPTYTDEVVASFERDLNRVPTPGSVTTVSTEPDPVQQTINDVMWTHPEQETQEPTATNQSNNPIATLGVDLIDWCEEPVSVYCRGYLLAVADTLADYRHLCLPENTTVSEMSRVFLTWARENPTRLNERASVLLDFAYGEVWACA